MTQIIGNVGMYYAAYRLSLLGWNVMPTARNARGIDLIAYNSDCSRMLALQIKALSKRDPVPLGNALEKLMGDYWLIVNRVISAPGVFIMTPDEVRATAHRGVSKDGKVSFWLQPTAYDRAEYREAWARIGNSGKEHPLSVATEFVKPPVVGSEVVPGIVASIHAYLNQHADMPAKDAKAALVAAGFNRNTVNTQYSRWLNAALQLDSCKRNWATEVVTIESKRRR